MPARGMNLTEFPLDVLQAAADPDNKEFVKRLERWKEAEASAKREQARAVESWGDFSQKKEEFEREKDDFAASKLRHQENVEALTRSLEQRESEIRSRHAELDRRMNDVSNMESEVSTKRHQLDRRASQLNGKEEELTARANDLEKREAELAAKHETLKEAHQSLLDWKQAVSRLPGVPKL